VHGEIFDAVSADAEVAASARLLTSTSPPAAPIPSSWSYQST